MEPVVSRREFGKFALGSSLAVAGSGGSLAHAQPAANEALLKYVHPELRAIAARDYASSLRAAPLSDASLAAFRAGGAASAKPPLPDVPITRRLIPGTRGAPDVALYVVNAKEGRARPGILHTHGGGFVAGSARFDLPRLQRIAQEIDCAIVTVEYRLAPETSWSGSLEDNYAGLKWLHANAQMLGIDVRKIAVMGESAGGGHAALLAIAARDRGEIALAFQCLVYPMLDDRTGVVRKMPPSIGWLGWTPQRNRYGWSSFLGVAPGGNRVPPAVPARVASVAGLPPAWIGVGSIDLFVQEDIAYATRLIEAGILTELVVVPGAPHGFDTVFDRVGVDVSIARNFNRNKIAALRRAFL